jgi:hypothetical protein
LIFGKNIAKIAYLGSKTLVLGKQHILKKISIGKRPFIGLCYIRWKITALLYNIMLKMISVFHHKIYSVCLNRNCYVFIKPLISCREYM